MKTAIQVVGKCIYAFLFLALLIIPISLTNTTENVKSSFDNRELVEFPEIGKPNFEKKIENYLHDRIGLRDELITGYQLVNNRITGELYHPIYTDGQDGYVFFNMHDNIEYNEYHDTFVDAVVKMNEYCNARGIHFYFLFDPEKISVYRRYLPVGVNYNDEWVDILIHNLEERGVKCVNNTSILIEKSQNKQVFNIKYDAGHWNDLGCFYGTNNLWRTIHEDFPAVTEYSLDEFEVSTMNGQYLASSKFPVNEEVLSFKPKFQWKDKSSKYSEIKLNKSYRTFRYFVNQTEEAEKYPKILVFHGSYYNRSPYFFVGRAREYIGVHDYQNVLNMDYYINAFQPDIAIFEVAEYTFSDVYFDSTLMKSMDYNPRIDPTVIMETGTKLDIDDGLSMCVIPEDGFDTVYYEGEILTAKYAYLVSGKAVFDMQETGQGEFSTAVSHGSLDEKILLVYESFTGEQYYALVGVQQAQRFVNNIEITNGIDYKSNQKEFYIQTSLKNNIFTSVNLQILDGITDECLGPLYSTKSAGNYSDSFTHERNTGWYKIRLKANSNMRDECIDIMAYLIQGKRYFFEFEVKELEDQRAVIKDYSLYGACPWMLERKNLFRGDKRSKGCNRTINGDFCFKTTLKDNRFSSVVLNLINTETGEPLNPISIEVDNGRHYGKYVHKAPPGEYVIRVRGNTNLQDEYVESTASFEEGMLYEWSYVIKKNSYQEITVSDISFIAFGQ